MREAHIPSPILRRCGTFCLTPGNRMAGCKTLNCSSELAHEEKVILQVRLQLSGPSSFEGSAFLVCSKKILGHWHLWFTCVFIAHVSNKLPETSSGSLYLYPLNQSDLSLELDLSCVCLWAILLYQGGEAVEGLAGEYQSVIEDNETEVKERVWGPESSTPRHDYVLFVPAFPGYNK